MANYAPYLTAAAATVGVAGSVYVAYQVYKESQKIRLPETWTEVGTLESMFIYPIKSCGAVRVEQAECAILGLKDGWLKDRVLMVVDAKYNFITARAYPEMLSVHCSVNSSILTLKHPDMELVKIDLAEVVSLGVKKQASVWGTSVPVYDCGWEPSEWLSRLINKSASDYRLVLYASHKARTLRLGTNPIFKFRKDDTGALPDETPYNIINLASVDDLNTRLNDCQVTYQNFRPNFVMRAATAFEEDKWKFVKIGKNVFEVIKPCTRCILTTIDPETGVRNKNILDTMKSYRQFEDPVVRKSAGSSPRMGLQLALRSGPGGLVQANDPIYAA